MVWVNEKSSESYKRAGYNSNLQYMFGHVMHFVSKSRCYAFVLEVR